MRPVGNGIVCSHKIERQNLTFDASTLVYSEFRQNFAGSNGLQTLLVVTGTGFTHENATIHVGDSECHVELVTSE